MGTLRLVERQSNSSSKKMVQARLVGDTAHFHPDITDEFAVLPRQSTLTPLMTDPVVPLVLTEDPTGSSRIGGEAPTGLVLPEGAFASGYHFIGEIDLSHIGGAGRIPLIYPLFVDDHPPVFLDMVDPMRPKLIPSGQAHMFNLAEPERPFATDVLPYSGVREAPEVAAIFRDGGAVTYGEFRGNFTPSEVILDDGLVSAGVPNWLQPPELPMCPRTGVPMRVVASIGGGLPVAACEVAVPESSLYAERFEHMSFWNNGVLFVFAHPGAGTLCLHPQDI